MSTYHQPIPLRARRADIEKLAEAFAAKTWLVDGGSLELLVEKLGGKIAYRAFGSSSASLVVENDAKFTVYLPDDTTPQRTGFRLRMRSVFSCCTIR